MMRRIDRQNTGKLCAGQDLIVAGNPGLSGAAVIAERFHSHLKTWFSEEYLEELKADSQNAEGALEPALAELGSEITESEPIGEGGVLKAIWNLTGAYETGVRFALRQIPLTQATIEICERFELNPYRLYSSSCGNICCIDFFISCIIDLSTEDKKIKNREFFFEEFPVFYFFVNALCRN